MFGAGTTGDISLGNVWSVEDADSLGEDEEEERSSKVLR
jgi:hypothetical protein